MTSIGIVDYGMGNLLSVYHAFRAVGVEPTICSAPDTLSSMDRLVLPGVGAFRDCMTALRTTGLADALNDAVRRRGVPILGICLGMQAMARRSSEGGDCEGFGWFDAEVVKLQPQSAGLRVPHMGWNSVTHRGGSVFSRLPEAPDFYFVHSYHMQCAEARDVEATCEYGVTIAAAVVRENVAATQFHPEKSQANGLRLLENFVGWKP